MEDNENNNIININFEENDKNKINENKLQIFNKKYKTELTLELNALELSKKGIDDEGFKLLSEIPFHQINTINLSNNSISDLTPLLKMNLDNLTQLNLCKNRIDNIDIFIKLNLSHLTILNLGGNRLKDFKVLEKVNLNSLNELLLYKNRIKDINSLEYMNCPNLRIIDLTENLIEDITVFERVKFPQLNEIRFAANYFDHEVIKNNDIISNLKKRGCNVGIYGTIIQKFC